MSENDSWGSHNLKTTADVARMLKGLPPEQEGEEIPPTPALPLGAVSATVERQLEDETGHDVVETSKDPPTYVETDKPAPQKDTGSQRRAK